MRTRTWLGVGIGFGGLLWITGAVFFGDSGGPVTAEENATEFLQAKPAASQEFRGLVFVKHGLVGSKSEGPQYFLQTFNNVNTQAMRDLLNKLALDPAIQRLEPPKSR